MKIYVPQDSTYNKCYVVQSEGVIRGYEKVPQVNSTVNYRDYYINSSYIYKDSYQTFSSYSIPPTCLDTDVLTNDVYYRNDFDSILIIFLILLLFCFYFPFKIVSRVFGKWLKL